MNQDMKIIREVNIEAEKFYEDAIKLGDHAAHALGNQHRAQITSLENIAESDFKTSDVFDYIKKQTARSKEARDWRRPLPNQNIGFGERLKHYLEHDLRQKLSAMCSPERLNIGDTTDEDRQRRRHIHLLLIRQFLRQMAVEYEYRVSLGSRQREQ